MSHTSELRERLTAPVLPSGPPHVQQAAPPDSSMNTVTSSQTGEAQLQKHPPASPMHYGVGSSDYTSGPPQVAKAQDRALALPQKELSFMAPSRTWDMLHHHLGITRHHHMGLNTSYIFRMMTLHQRIVYPRQAVIVNPHDITNPPKQDGHLGQASHPEVVLHL